jgi:hypothetical protein
VLRVLAKRAEKGGLRLDLLVQDAGLNGATLVGVEPVPEAVTLLKELPRTAEALGAYDAVMLIDPDFADADPAEGKADRRLTPAFADALAEAVAKKGTGLVFSAGPQHSAGLLGEAVAADGNPAKPNPFAKLAALLPVRVAAGPPPKAAAKAGDAEAKPADEGGIQEPAERTEGVALSPSGGDAALRDHPLMQMVPKVPDPEARVEINRAAWERLPRVHWTLKTVGEPRSGATVLATAEGRGPALALMTVGKGRTVYLGFDSTWRWRSGAGGEWRHLQFWRQAIAFAAEGRPVLGSPVPAPKNDGGRDN